MAWDHRSVEGVLYGLGRPPDARPAAPSVSAVPRHSMGPRAVPAGVARRLDVSLAQARLSPDDIRVVREHYVTGARRHPRQVRKPIIGRLLAVLNEEG